MRSQLWLLAASGHAAWADWAFGQALDHPRGEAALLMPRETRASTHDGANGWTPRPTDGPSIELARGRLKAKRQTANTCGWFVDFESEPFLCATTERCATNSDNVVGCTSSGATTNPFFTVCLDYQAVQNGACNSLGPQTGCCMTKSIGECITYLWPGPTVKSMYGCYSTRGVFSMQDTPAISSTTRVTSRRSSSTSTTSTSETSTETTETGTGTTAVPGQTETGAPPPASSSGGSNTGAIVGGVVGGVAGIALIAGAIAFFVIRSRKKNNSNVGGGTAYSAVAPGDPAFPGSPMPPTGYAPSSASPQMSQAGGYYNPSSVGTALQHPETPYLASTTPPVPGAYDPRNSYYDPAKPAGYVPYPGPTPPQGGLYPGAYPPQPQPQPVSELDTSSAPAGHQSNPVEMAVDPPTQR
ncbi:hypothetical protein C8A01DRAFT_38323 [Parachaetomium inaequale]|uniref:Uncharacterized protein n=1 Tax=Parachaetomium inaequale TaxID=2588326 RepID=A0AAN6SNT0_9PEZI|nr:hypothetical protein C8A01DRAFT_38323 [Parachaetomium inaequale]